MVDALWRIAAAAEVIGVRLAKFEASPTDPIHLLLLMKDLRRALNG